MRILPQPDTTSDKTFHYTIIMSSALTMAQVYAGANCEFHVGTMCDDAIRAALYDDMSLIQISESADSFASMVGGDDERHDADEMNGLLNTMVSEDAVSDYLQQNGYGADDAAAIDRYRNAIDVDAVRMNCGASYNQADFGWADEKDYPFDVVIVSDVGTLNSEYGSEMLMPCDISILLDDDIDSDLMLAVLRTMSYVIAPTSFDGSKSTYGMRNIKFLYDTANLMMQYPSIPCNDCKYCMPCPYGIDIPGILLHYNKCVNEGYIPESSQAENYREARRAFLVGYDRSVPRLRQASHCIGCRQCEPECPQNIAIAQEMQRIDRFVENLKQGNVF